MRVLVVGGAGFIGSFVVSRLVELGHEVTVFSRGRAESSLPVGVRRIYGDRAKLADFKDEFGSLRPDVILHMIAYTQRDAETLVTVSRGLARRLVVISSADVYRARDRFCRADPGPPDATPLTEDSPLRERLFPYAEPRPELQTEAYATTYEKNLVERAAMSDPDLPATILRLPQVYGPGDWQHRFFAYLKRMDDGRPFILLPQDMAGWRAPRGYVEDVAEAIVLCVTSEKAAGRIYHVGDRENLTEADCVRRIGCAAGWNGELILLPNERLPQSLQHHYDTRQDWSLDSSRIRSELGYIEPTPPDVAMQRTIEWERSNPPKEIDKAEFDYSAEDAARVSG
jgi:nucleoside-diphosphate-sugar epimerase